MPVAMLCLVLAGIAQSMSMISAAVILMRTASARLRGRVMGVRMMVIYGLPLGLLAAGSLIDLIGYTADGNALCSVRIADDGGDCATLARRALAGACAGECKVGAVQHVGRFRKTAVGRQSVSPWLFCLRLDGAPQSRLLLNPRQHAVALHLLHKISDERQALLASLGDGHRHVLQSPIAVKDS